MWTSAPLHLFNLNKDFLRGIVRQSPDARDPAVINFFPDSANFLILVKFEASALIIVFL